MSDSSSATRELPVGVHPGLDWLQSRDFYELCQSYRWAEQHNRPEPIGHAMNPSAAEAFERLKLSIADHFVPALPSAVAESGISHRTMCTAEASGMYPFGAVPGGLTSEAIVLLLHDYTKVGKPDIRAILKALPQLRGYYCRKA